MIGSPADNGERLGNPVRIWDGPAAVRGEAPLPRRHWPKGWEDGEGGRPESEDLSLAATGPLEEGGFVRKRILTTVVVSVVLVGVFVPLAGAVSVSVRVEGKTQTLFGSTEPRLQVASTALDALTTAARMGEFYYHLVSSSSGSYVDQVGLYPATDTGGWMFKVNGVLPPVGAGAVTLKSGDRVLWYWARFDPVTFAGPKTLQLTRSKLTRSERAGAKRSHESLYCYTVSAQDDNGASTPAVGAVLRAGSRRAATGKKGRACLRAHAGSLVRATLNGAVRSNALP